jgi:hypothetical protein
LYFALWHASCRTGYSNLEQECTRRLPFSSPALVLQYSLPLLAYQVASFEIRIAALLADLDFIEYWADSSAMGTITFVEIIRERHSKAT